VSTTIKQFVRELRAFADRREVTKQLRADLREPIPDVRRDIKASALATMPKRGGLNRWVASIRVTAQVSVSSTRVRVRVRGGRNSSKTRSDINAIDRGRVRHPAWGRRFARQWSTQSVPEQFFTRPAAEPARWEGVMDKALDRALERLRRG
jgi:hypothetical protein